MPLGKRKIITVQVNAQSLGWDRKQDPTLRAGRGGDGGVGLQGPGKNNLEREGNVGADKGSISCVYSCFLDFSNRDVALLPSVGKLM